MEQVILALDQGTTSSRAILFDAAGSIRCVAQQEFPQHYPQPGWVEHDPEDIWASQRDVAVRVVQQCKSNLGEIAAIGITNQRETTLLWERRTGRPVYTAIVWQDRRTADRCAELTAAGHAPLFREKTGLQLDPYFSGTKLAWLLDNIAGLRQRAERGELAFGTIDTFLMWRLSDGRIHATDASNASRTLLFNILSGDWDDELLAVLNIPRALLPEIRPSSHLFGETDAALFGRPIPIGGVAGDQQAATFGQACHLPGAAKNTYGTGSFLLMNTGPAPKFSRHGLLTTVAWQLEGGASSQEAATPPMISGPIAAQHGAMDPARSFGDLQAAAAAQPKTGLTYALEGSVFVTGAAVQWLRDELKIIGTAAEIEPLANSVRDTGGVYFVPAFAGLGTPYWDPYARGAILGLTRGTGRAHLARAALEAVCFQSVEVVEAMRADAGTPLTELRVDGGMTVNDTLLQMQANLLGAPVVRPAITETTALGAAYLAGLAVGFWSGLPEIRAQWRADRIFEPTMGSDARESRIAGWRRAVSRVRDWAID